MTEAPPPAELPDAPSSPDSAPRFSLRRLVQFRLRTLLLLTVAAAFYTQWSLRPKPETQQFGDYQLFHHLVNITVDANYGGGEGQVEDGAYWITDKQGRLLVRGAFDKGVPCGTWRTYHPNGRLASIGKCDKRTGAREGVWKSYHANGRLAQTMTYGKSRARDPELSLYSTERISVREGPAEGWHDNSQLRWRGGFQNDVQHGDWEFYDDDGQLIASGAYQSGRRHGRWQIVESDDSTRTAYYIYGGQAPDPRQVDDAQLDAWMTGDVEARRLDAIQLAAHTGRWEWLSRHLPKAASQQQLQILRIAILYEAAAQPLLNAAQRFEQSDSPRLRAAATALRYSANPAERPTIIKELANLPPDRRRQVAGELIELDPYGFRAALRTDSEKISQFALQCLLCRWADRRNEFSVRVGVFPQGPDVRTVLSDANADTQIPPPVRQLIQKWLDDTSPKGLQGGFF